MPHTEGSMMSDEDQQQVVNAIKEMAIKQYLDGLRANPEMLPRLRGMAERDPGLAEAIRRYDAEQ